MQIPVEFEFQSNLSFDSYFPGKNFELFEHLKQFAVDGTEQQIFIWGDRASGKSHLLQACCQMAKQHNKDPFYLAFTKEERFPLADLLEGLDQVELVCFDDIQHLSANADWQLAFFNFYNQHRQNNHKLLLAADCPPKFLPFELIDLKTRMNWGLNLKIQALKDDELIEALTHRAHFLGFDIPFAVGEFLLNHYVHELPALWLLLDKIDHATLAAKRKLTIPFLKQILAEEA